MELRERVEKMYGSTLSEIRGFKHSHLVNSTFHNGRKYSYVKIEKPSPIFNPCRITNLEQYQDVFATKEKLKKKLAHYRQLHAKETKWKNGSVKKGIDGLPSYLVEVAKNIEEYEDDEYSYTGGVLDCISFNGTTYIMWAGFKQPVHIVDLNNPEINAQICSSDLVSVYNIKSAATVNGFLLSTRQKQTISLYSLLLEESLNYSLLWKADGKKTFSDMAINEFKNSNFSIIDEHHKLIITDIVKNQVITTNSFPNPYNCDNNILGQITYIDANTICFMNRCCIYLFDVRSSNIQKSCLKLEGLECDDLCALSKNVNHNNLCISSQHNLIKFDIQAWKCQGRTMHMLSTPPFISSLMSCNDEEYISVMGSDYKDKTIFNNTKDSLNLTQYVPNIFDTYRSASLTSKVLKFSEYIDKRLTLPNLGAKLHLHDGAKEVTLYTLNTIGDVFQQKLIKSESIDSHNDVLVNWVDALPEPSKSFEVIGCLKLDYVMDNMSRKFPKKKVLKAYLNNDNSAKFLEDNKSILDNYVGNNVADAVNSVWNLEEESNGVSS